MSKTTKKPASVEASETVVDETPASSLLDRLTTAHNATKEVPDRAFSKAAHFNACWDAVAAFAPETAEVVAAIKAELMAG